MNGTDHIVAISYKDHKHAALFFEKVFPVDGFDKSNELPPELSYNPLIKNINRYTIGPEHIDDFVLMLRNFTFRVANIASGHTVFEHNFGDVPESKVTRELIDLSLIKYYTLEAQANGFLAVPIVNSRKYFTLFQAQNPEAMLEITFGNLPLVATENAQWEQIIELRNDKDAKRKLRNLRLFFHNTYKDKSIAYIKDHLDLKIDEYEGACKKHGFELVSSSLTSILDSKSLIGTIGLSTAGVLLGEPTLTSTALVSGAIIETSKIVIKLSQQLLDFSLFKRNNELAYIFAARKRLKNESKLKQLES